MINIKNKQTCSGCCACLNVCPKRCITMEADSEGFWYPKVQTELCIDCQRCEKVCPLIEGSVAPAERLTSPLVFAAWNRNKSIRLDSTSGGIFSALADKTFDAGGYVAGAIYNKDYTVKHKVTIDNKILDDMRSSKYLQSYTGELFNEVARLLENDHKVLICATPCQIAGLYSVLRKDYENLITCDFICLGISSPKVFLKYIEMLEKQHGSKATKIKFKDKTYGWHRFATRIDFANGKTYIKDRYNDPYMLSLLKGHLVRPSCYECQFKNMPRQADITLADFWGIEKIHPELDNDCGTSVVMLNSKKGREFFQGIDKAIVAEECSIGEVADGNPAMNRSIEYGCDRKSFFADIDRMSFSQLADKYFPVPNQFSKITRKISKKLKKRIRKILGFETMGFSLSARLQFIYMNILRKATSGMKRFGFIPTPHSRIDIDKSAQVVLNSALILGFKQNRKSKNETRLSLGKNSSMTINGRFKVQSGSDIRVFDNGELTLNGGFCNVGTQIVCFKKITIGKGCAIARDVLIQDSDAHQFVNSNHVMSQEIIIGDHVWIGYRAMILKGVTVGDGAVIAAGAIVTKNVPEKCLVAGIPAKVIRRNVEWK